MSLIFVTGISGSGKSEVLKELKSRGIEAYGTDEDAVAGFYDRTTDKLLTDRPVKAETRTPEWRAKYVWKMTRSKVEDLAESAKDHPIYLCGVAENENEMWDLFGNVLALAIDEETLKQRLADRTDNDFGKQQHELDDILAWQRSTDEAYRKFGHIVVDATRPINEVVDEIVRITKPVTS